MASKKEIALHNAAAEYKVFLESLSYPGLDTEQFVAAKNRFNQLFEPLCIEAKETKVKDQ
ncbi:MAG: hypothetical protein PHC63_06985 [Candidatus Bathyarchaeota archaeon]|jgi:hypothetical protein|nr:hypothetical protein [Candidatus Bathyarchaeota archaeon]